MNVDMTITLNINDMVRVYLTPEGETVLQKFEVMRLEAKIPRGPQNSLRCSLWNLMEIFGPATWHGGPALFLDNAIIVEEEPT
jgi:hypothetical protein